MVEKVVVGEREIRKLFDQIVNRLGVRPSAPVRWEGEPKLPSGLSVEGRPRGGGDPRVAYRDQAGVQDDGSKMMCGK